MTKKYIVHGISCNGSGKKTNEYDTMEEAKESMEDWMGWWYYYKDIRNLEGTEEDFFIEELNDNEHMNELTKRLNEYERECKRYEEEKEAKRAELDRDEFWAWYEKHDKPEYPLTRGQAKAWHLWYWNEREELNFDDFVWEKEAKDFIDTLRAAGVKTFTMTNDSTALMENMHWFQENGCTLMGLCEVDPMDEWERKHNGMKKGVRFAL